MESKKKSIKHHSKKMSLQAKTQEKVRLTLHCTPEQRKYIKMYAAHEDVTLNDFILNCVLMKISGCPQQHIPNDETAAALDSTERGEGLIHFDSVDDFMKSLRS